MKTPRLQNPSHGELQFSTLSAAFALLCMVFLAYLPAISADYIWDDDFYITENIQLRTPAGLNRIWTDSSATPQYYPIVHTSYWIEYQLWGLNPLGYHIVNILLHSLNAALLFRILTVLRVPGAFLAAALFALHPVHVESVAWITERKNVLSGLFYLLSFLAYWRFASPKNTKQDPHSKRQWKYYAAAMLLYGFALLSKSVTCSLPAVILLVLWWKQDRLSWRTVLPLLPMFAVGIGAGLNTAYLETTHVGAKGLDWDWSFGERCLIAGRAIWFYAAKLLWPNPLVFIYPKWHIDTAIWWQSLFPISAVALVVTFWLNRQRLGRGPLVGLLFFGGTLLPALGFIDVYPMRYSFVADHFQYLASIGLLSLFAAVIVLVAERSQVLWKLSLLGMTCILFGLGFVSFTRCYDFQDRESLWVATLEKNPDCWMSSFNLAAIRFEQRRFVEADLLFRKALKDEQGDEPSDEEKADLHRYLGDTCMALGRTDSAQEHFQLAGKYYQTLLNEISPQNPEHYNNLGILFGKMGDPEKAMESFQSALNISPHDAKIHLNLGELYYQAQKYDLSAEHFQKVLETDPTNSRAHYNLAVSFFNKGDRPSAVKHAREALRSHPNFSQAQLILNQALDQ